jgi:hypothetical protein
MASRSQESEVRSQNAVASDYWLVANGSQDWLAGAFLVVIALTTSHQALPSDS